MYFETRQDPGSVCASKGNQLSICAPTNTDTWNSIDIYLYYKSNFQYILIKTWPKLPRLNGVMSVTVDDSWFSKTAYNNNVTWTLSFYILPTGMDSTSELQNVASQFPKPIDFNVIQFPSSNPPSSDNNNNNNNNNNNGTNSTVGSSRGGSTTIVLSPLFITFTIVAICIVICVFLCTINRIRKKKQQFVLDHEDPCKNVEFQDNTIYNHCSHLDSNAAIATSEVGATKPFSNEPSKTQSCKPFDNQSNGVELASVKPFDNELKKK